MKYKIKSNKLLIFALIILCFIFIFNPVAMSRSCLNAISVWAFSVLPVLLPFFIVTKLILSLSTIKQTKADKLFFKLYNTPAGTAKIYFLSLLSGYPVGAKMIGEMYENNYINSADAKRMLAFCSMSGPGFIVGTIGALFLKSFKAGIIILIANILASILNGFLYRGKKVESKKENINIKYEQKTNILESSVYNSLISILMVGAYIVISFLLIDVVKNLGIISFLANIISSVFNIKPSQHIVESVLSGLIEMTRGLNEIGASNLGLNLKIIISSGMVAFGGFSVFLQSLNFINKLSISPKYILLQKTSQGILASIIAFILTLIFV